jgi:adenine-specific DNA-methyltransferase
MWLNMMKERLFILHRLLRTDGTLWISIDDDECHYLTVVCDEIFGRNNFVANVIWEKKYTQQNDAKWISDVHDHILVYAKSADLKLWNRAASRGLNLLPRTEQMNSSYKNPDNDPRGPWRSINLSVKTYSKANDYVIIGPQDTEFRPPPSRAWAMNRQRYEELLSDGRIWFGKDGQARPYLKTFLSEVQQGSVSKSLWFRTETGDNKESKREAKAFNPLDVFATPKPERLIHRILTLASDPGDLVLDCFAGSGTTGAVAHKMGRRWIMIEMGNHAMTHIVPRLQMIVDGSEPGGVTESTSWQGGGGFRFCEIAPSLLLKDDLGRWKINPSYTPAMLRQAMCLHAGFSATTGESPWWCHGQSTNGDFIYVTPTTVSYEQLASLSEEVGPHRSLLIFCAAFLGDADDFDNLTIQKIPKSVLNKCE